jgi:hypothetical protein
MYCGIAKGRSGVAVETIPSRTITRLTGMRGRMLHELCNSLSIGETKQGAERHFSIVEALLLTLVARLHQHGLRRSEAIAIGLSALRHLAQLLLNRGAEKRWLFAHRLMGPEPWAVRVADDAEAADILRGTISKGHVIVDLRALVEQVELEATGGARQ